MDITFKVSGEEALSWQNRLRRAQHSRAPLKSLLYAVIRQAVKAQAKAELEALLKETYAATADASGVDGDSFGPLLEAGPIQEETATATFDQGKNEALNDTRTDARSRDSQTRPADTRTGNESGEQAL